MSNPDFKSFEEGLARLGPGYLPVIKPMNFQAPVG